MSSTSARLPSGTVRRVLVTGGVVLALAGSAAACGATGPNATQLYRLRMCESGGNYGINTGNGYFGAYQFNLGTWQSLGFGGYPNTASPATQDAAVARLYSQSGWRSWPVCGRGL